MPRSQDHDLEACGGVGEVMQKRTDRHRGVGYGCARCFNLLADRTEQQSPSDPEAAGPISLKSTLIFSTSSSDLGRLSGT